MRLMTDPVLLAMTIAACVSVGITVGMLFTVRSEGRIRAPGTYARSP